MRDIRIVGGGIAGLSLGIRLAQAGIPTVVFEAGNYPRHRVCGEFISGSGPELLDAMLPADELARAGSQTLTTAAFYAPDGHAFEQPLPQPARGLSRHALDALLARVFVRSGGRLETATRWQGSFDEEGVVRATGRRVHLTDGGWRFVGLKAHAEGVALKADLEMHLHAGGYIGLSRIERGLANVCGLFWTRSPEPGLHREWEQRLRGHPGSALHDRMERARFLEDTFCAVAGLSFGPQDRADEGVSLGDAHAVIAPLAGNGISMALESATLAAPALREYANGGLNWPVARERVLKAFDRQFARRLFWAGWLQDLARSPRSANAVLRLCNVAPALWRAGFTATR